jgi:hypothetical protein
MDTFCKHLAAACKSSRPEARLRFASLYVTRAAATTKADQCSRFKDQHLLEAFQCWRLQFCEEFMACMPPELRDMTHGYLLEPEYIIRYYPQDRRYHNIARNFNTVDVDPIGRASPMNPEIKDMFEAEKVGGRFVDEVSRLFNERTSLDILEVSQLEHALRYPVLPRGLRIHWWGRKFLFDDYKSIKKNLLELLPNRAVQGRVAIEIVLHLDPSLCPTFLCLIAPTVFKLKDKGVKFSIVRSCVRRKRNYPSYYAAYYSKKEHDMTWLFAGSWKDFENNIKINGRPRRSLVSTSLTLMEPSLIGSTDQVGRSVQEGWSTRWLRPPTHCSSRGPKIAFTYLGMAVTQGYVRAVTARVVGVEMAETTSRVIGLES